jgi:hypothetical protein
MGLVDRKKSGKIINGSKLNVEGQGILTTKKGTQDKLVINPKTDNN